MAVGYVFIKAKEDKRAHVRSELQKKKKMEERYELSADKCSDGYGSYDFVVKVEMDSFDEVSMYIVNEIRSIEGIARTKTHMGITF